MSERLSLKHLLCFKIVASLVNVYHLETELWVEVLSSLEIGHGKSAFMSQEYIYAEGPLSPLNG